VTIDVCIATVSCNYVSSPFPREKGETAEEGQLIDGFWLDSPTSPAANELT
jgi:hypothetical protein